VGTSSAINLETYKNPPDKQSDTCGVKKSLNGAYPTGKDRTVWIRSVGADPVQPEEGELAIGGISVETEPGLDLLS